MSTNTFAGHFASTWHLKSIGCFTRCKTTNHQTTNTANRQTNKPPNHTRTNKNIIKATIEANSKTMTIAIAIPVTITIIAAVRVTVTITMTMRITMTMSIPAAVTVTITMTAAVTVPITPTATIALTHVL